MNGLAILVGCDGFGGIAILAERFRRYGYSRVIGLVNAIAKYSIDPGIASVELHECDVFDPIILSEMVRKLAGDQLVPFLCAADAAMFSFLTARSLLGYKKNTKTLRIPDDAILRARIKPAARRRWRSAHVENTNWTVVSDLRDTEMIHDAEGKLARNGKSPKYVKPICGAGSENVSKVNTWGEVRKKRDEIHRHFAKSGRNMDETIDVDGCKYQLYRDVIVEEALVGAEYTIDGWANCDGAAYVAQHKETRWVSCFFGDGGIYAPPDVKCSLKGVKSPLQFTGTPIIKREAMDAFVNSGAKALGISEWCFHAEAICTSDGKWHFIEINPRPAGGLLWRTAGLHLGMDTMELAVRLHLGHECLPVRGGWVTAQFPLYVLKKGREWTVEGVECAREIKFVERVTVLKSPAGGAKSLDEENYAAFVCIHAPSHAEARAAEAAVRRCLKLAYKN